MRSIESKASTGGGRTVKDDDMSRVKFLKEITDPKVSELGGKGYSLAALMNNGFNVPEGFVTVSEIFFEFLKDNNLMGKVEELLSELNESNSRELSKDVRDLILQGKVPARIAVEISEALEKLNVMYVSVRSSAVSEDSFRTSFAGLYDTLLNIRTETEKVLECVEKCWASLFNGRAVLYRIRKQIPHLEGMAVVVQEMIPADISGTVFTAHPDTGNRNMLVVESSWGLGQAIVSGSITPDRHIVDKKSLEIGRRTLGRKKIIVRTREGGIEQIETPKDKADILCLNDTMVRNLVKISLDIETLFDYPQDIEWCIHKNRIWILQSRPITSLEVETWPAQQ